MALSLMLVLAWGVAACIAGLAPQRFHGPSAWALIATGIPILGLVTLALGPVWGLVGLVAGALVLRVSILRAGLRLAGLLAPQEREHPGE